MTVRIVTTCPQPDFEAAPITDACEVELQHHDLWGRLLSVTSCGKPGAESYFGVMCPRHFDLEIELRRRRASVVRAQRLRNGKTAIRLLPMPMPIINPPPPRARGE